MSEKLDDATLGVMKFAASTNIIQLAMFGAMGGEQFYSAMREGLTEAAEREKTEKVINAIKALTEAMGGEAFSAEVVSALKG